LARKEIEVQFGLIKAQTKPKERLDLLQTIDKALYGRSETKKTIDKIVGMVIQNYNCTSLIEFNAALRQFNVMADRGKEGSTMYQKNGVVYWILDDRGNKIGVPIKASALVSRPTMRNLQSTFEANAQVRSAYKERLTTVIDSFFAGTDGQARADFCDYLNVNGINPVFRENKDGRVYGITFIDNRKGAVINASDLGKAYSGQALVKRFNIPSATGRIAGERKRQERVEQWIESPQRGSNERSEANCLQNISPPFLGLMKAEKLYAEPVTPMFKRKRKKKRGISP